MVRGECSATSMNCGCNQSPHSLDWNHTNNLVVFASASNVCLISGKHGDCLDIFECLHGHKALVNCVKWVIGGTGCTNEYFVSGSADGGCILWKVGDCDAEIVAQLKIDSPISHVLAYADGNGKVNVVVCSAENCVRIWEWTNGTDFRELKSLPVGAGFAMCSDVIKIGNSGYLLALALDRNIIKFFASFDDKEYEYLTEISGHTDWIRHVSFKMVERKDSSECDIYIASCSQDTYVRIWKISKFVENSDDGQLKVRPKIFLTKGVEYSIVLESVLCGHESWVYGVRWHPTSMALLTSSMDKSIILWQPETDSGVWIENVKLGNVGGQSVGYYGAVFNKDASKVLAHSYHGGLRLWNKNGDGWVPGVVCSGHSNSVEDICWDFSGEYLLSCSLDQTTRLYAKWRRDEKECIHEVSRPQMHGYDMKCICLVNRGCFISGAEEKIFRVFSAPKNFCKNYANITKTEIEITTADAPEGASVPSLGLSNKAVEVNGFHEQGDTEQSPKDLYPVYNFMDVVLSEPPSEDILLQNTLWPEIHKLYGHGSEVFCVCCNKAGTLCASACKATKLEHAQIIIWCTKTWQIVTRLTNHNLTVTRLQFSPCDTYLLSVSRDRTFAIFEKDSDENWDLLVKSDKKTCHTRIIWDCCWTFDGKYFLTASRDKKVMAWKFEPNCDRKISFVSALNCEDSVTAVHAASAVINGSYLIAVGLDNGKVQVYSTDDGFEIWKVLEFERNSLNHSGSVKRLQFRPVIGSWIYCEKRSGFELASAACDNCVKINFISLSV